VRELHHFLPTSGANYSPPPASFVFLMVRSYLRWESDASGSFGLISSGGCNVLLQRGGTIGLSAGGESVLVWNIKQGQIIAKLRAAGHEFSGPGAQKRGLVTCLAAHPADPSIIAAGYSDGLIRFWNLSSRTSTVTLHGHRGVVSSLLFSVDGSRLFSGGQDTDLICWDVVGEQGLFRLKGHKAPITCLAYLDGENGVVANAAAGGGMSQSYVLSGSKDTLVKVWEVATQHCIQTLVGHRSEVCAIAIHVPPTSTTMTGQNQETKVVTAAAEGPLRVWTVRSHASSGPSSSNKAETKHVEKTRVKIEPGTIPPASSPSSATSPTTASTPSDSDPSSTPSTDILDFWGFLPRESTRRVVSMTFYPPPPPPPSAASSSTSAALPPPHRPRRLVPPTMRALHCCWFNPRRRWSSCIRSVRKPMSRRKSRDESNVKERNRRNKKATTMIPMFV